MVDKVARHKAAFEELADRYRDEGLTGDDLDQAIALALNRLSFRRAAQSVRCSR
jgi:hypothetical protein